MNRKTLEKLARVGMEAIDASRGYRAFGPYEGLGTANAAMQRVVDALEAADLSMSEVDDARREFEPECVMGRSARALGGRAEQAGHDPPLLMHPTNILPPLSDAHRIQALEARVAALEASTGMRHKAGASRLVDEPTHTYEIDDEEPLELVYEESKPPRRAAG